MSETNYRLVTGDPSIHDWQRQLDDLTWPLFLLQDIKKEGSWAFIYEHFLAYQFAYFDGEKLVGVGNSLGLFYDGSMEDLPAKGLDWAAKKSKEDIENNVSPNIMIAVQIMLHPQYKNLGLSYLMVNTMKEIGKSQGFSCIALPVRPTLKRQFPFLSMEEYINQKDNGGLPFDPWLRVHTKLGATLIGPCNESMYVSGSIEDWSQWTGLKIDSPGIYAIEGALLSITVDTMNDTISYYEPNVWMVYNLV